MIAALIKQYFYLIATAFAVAILLFLFLRNYSRKHSLSCQLSSLVTVLFSCLLTREYPENIYLFERRVHKQKMKCIRYLKCTANNNQAKHDEWANLRLFEIILDIGQLRRRVSDHTVFALCEKELFGLQQGMAGLIAVPSDSPVHEQRFAELAQAINQFEDVFEHVVKVAAREPLVFILFISGLREYQRLLQGTTDLAPCELNEGAR